MSASASLEATLRLEISQLQANLAKADGEMKRFQDGLRKQSKAGTRDVDDLTKAHDLLATRIARTNDLFAPKAVNPWTTASASARQYAQVVETQVVPALQKQAAASAWTARTGEGMDSNRLMAQQAMRQRVAAEGAAARLAGGRGGAMHNLGMVSMQAQDIAVQLQMGTKASIVLAQQGSQLLSAFGAGGALAGGLVAIGGLFFTLGEKAKAAFEEAKIQAADFNKEMSLLMKGGMTEAIEGVGKADDRLKGLHGQMEELMNSSGVWNSITALLGGPTVDEKQRQLNEDITATREAQARVGERLVEMSAQEVDLAMLKARGETEKAEVMEREMALAREIAKINAMPVAGNQRTALIEDARARSAAAVEAKKLADARRDVLRLDEEIREMNLSALDPAQRAVVLAKEQAKVFEEMHAKGGMFFEQTTQGLQKWAEALRASGNTTGLAEALKMLEKVMGLQRQIDQTEGKDDAAADNARKRAEAAQAKADFDGLSRAEKIAKLQQDIEAAKGQEQFAFEMGAEQAQYEAQLKRIELQEQLNGLIKEEADAQREAQEKREDSAAEQIKQHDVLKQFAAEMQEKALRADGHDKEADALAKQRKLENDARSLAESAGIGYEQALNMVRQLDQVEEKMEQRRKREQGGGKDGNERRKIYHTGRVIGMGGGLSKWEEMQARGPGEFGPGLSGKGPYGEVGAKEVGGLAKSGMSGIGESSAGVNAINEYMQMTADRQDGAKSSQGQLVDLTRKQNELLMRVMFGGS